MAHGRIYGTACGLQRIGFYFQYHAVQAAREAANAAGNGAKETAVSAAATKKSVEWAVDSTKRLQQAYIYIQEAKVEPVEKGLNLTIRIANGGATPAMNVTRSSLETAEGNLPAIILVQKIRDEAKGATDNGAGIALLAPKEDSQKVTFRINEVQIKSRTYLCGRIGWTDVFDDKHYLCFSYLLIDRSGEGGSATDVWLRGTELETVPSKKSDATPIE